jgi:hypothetical protein
VDSLGSLNFEGDHFSAGGSHDGTVIRVWLRGDANLHVAEAVARLLMGLHNEVKRLKASTVVVDFSRLEFINSACLKRFVTWISHVRDLDATAQYQIRLVANERVPWQRRSMSALRCVAVRLVSLET